MWVNGYIFCSSGVQPFVTDRSKTLTPTSLINNTCFGYIAISILGMKGKFGFQ